jgi:hypothetical protein
MGWLGQLTKVRDQVVDMEKRRETERRLERERNEQALGKRLKEDTAAALIARFAELHKRFDRDARKFYPLPSLEGVEKDLKDLCDLLLFYEDCMKQFAKVFTPEHKTAIPSLIAQIKDMQTGLERQLGQWREVKTAAEPVAFRARKAGDDPALVASAKVFSDRAHKVALSIPGDFYAREGENFWVVEAAGALIGHVKFAPADKTMSFALAPAGAVNFTKFVRAALYKFCVQGPLPQPLAAVRVRVAFGREAKFFTDMAFVRAETKGPAEWVYQRDL